MRRDGDADGLAGMKAPENALPVLRPAAWPRHKRCRVALASLLCVATAVPAHATELPSSTPTHSTATSSSSPARPSAGRSLADYPFWNLVAGWWVGESTYLGPNLDYKIRSYQSIVHVEIDGTRFRETEYKFYPPGAMATAYGRGQVRDGEGVETVTVLGGELVDDVGTVRILSMLPAMSAVATESREDEQTIVRVLGPDTGVRVTPNPRTGVDTYRMFIFVPAPDRRFRSNFGIVSDGTGPGAANALPGAVPGDLRGYSLFREARIAPGEFEQWRRDFRERNAVSAIVEPDAAGRPAVRRLAP